MLDWSPIRMQSDILQFSLFQNEKAKQNAQPCHSKLPKIKPLKFIKQTKRCRCVSMRIDHWTIILFGR